MSTGLIKKNCQLQLSCFVSLVKKISSSILLKKILNKN